MTRFASDNRIQLRAVLPSLLPNWPLPIWMLVITLILGLSGGLSAPDLVRHFNTGFGQALGEFALILLPSFTLAAAMDQHNMGAASGFAVAASPLSGAGMICPDTAYAALSPIAGRNRLDVAFGAYTGFKLLYPAGPLIVATGLGVQENALILYGLALVFPVWAAGALWVRFLDTAHKEKPAPGKSVSIVKTASIFAPFILLAILLVVGAIFNFSDIALLDFITRPKGALLTAATLALAGIAAKNRRACLETAIRRTASLLLLIGLASAFGSILIQVVPLEAVLPTQTGIFGIIGLFLLAALFKIAQGSSMATFAAVAPVAAPLVAGMDIPPVAAVFAICAGSFVAILPNDSFYWLVRRDALQQNGDGRALSLLAGGATLQALTCLAIILLAVGMGLV